MCKNHILSDLALYEKCRQLSQNFIWFFQSCQKYSPMVNLYGGDDETDLENQFYFKENTAAGLLEAAKISQEQPIYMISLKNFMRVLNKINSIKFSLDEIVHLAKAC